eukprot:g3794.t1
MTSLADEDAIFKIISSFVTKLTHGRTRVDDRFPGVEITESSISSSSAASLLSTIPLPVLLSLTSKYLHAIETNEYELDDSDLRVQRLNMLCTTLDFVLFVKEQSQSQKNGPLVSCIGTKLLLWPALKMKSTAMASSSTSPPNHSLQLLQLALRSGHEKITTIILRLIIRGAVECRVDATSEAVHLLSSFAQPIQAAIASPVQSIYQAILPLFSANILNVSQVKHTMITNILEPLWIDKVDVDEYDPEIAAEPTITAVRIIGIMCALVYASSHKHKSISIPSVASDSSETVGTLVESPQHDLKYLETLNDMLRHIMVDNADDILLQLATLSALGNQIKKSQELALAHLSFLPAADSTHNGSTVYLGKSSNTTLSWIISWILDRCGVRTEWPVDPPSSSVAMNVDKDEENENGMTHGQTEGKLLVETVDLLSPTAVAIELADADPHLFVASLEYAADILEQLFSFISVPNLQPSSATCQEIYLLSKLVHIAADRCVCDTQSFDASQRVAALEVLTRLASLQSGVDVAARIPSHTRAVLHGTVARMNSGDQKYLKMERDTRAGKRLRDVVGALANNRNNSLNVRASALHTSARFIRVMQNSGPKTGVASSSDTIGVGSDTAMSSDANGIANITSSEFASSWLVALIGGDGNQFHKNSFHLCIEYLCREWLFQPLPELRYACMDFFSAIAGIQGGEGIRWLFSCQLFKEFFIGENTLTKASNVYHEEEDTRDDSNDVPTSLSLSSSTGQASNAQGTRFSLRPTEVEKEGMEWKFSILESIMNNSDSTSLSSDHNTPVVRRVLAGPVVEHLASALKRGPFQCFRDTSSRVKVHTKRG